MTVQPFEMVVTEHGPTVMRVCRALLRPADAEDAWAETFIAAMRAYPTLRADSNIRAWLVTIAHRKALDQIRSSSRAATPTGEIDRMIDRSADSGQDAYAAPDSDLWNAVQSLTPNQQAAVVYHHVAGVPFAEIGELLGISAAAARRSSADGIANLRRRYSPASSPTAVTDSQELSS
ncbi:MAG: sigma-70 family RNA polymerase sigma factor [Ilumatobacteraceae bacterium]